MNQESKNSSLRKRRKERGNGRRKNSPDSNDNAPDRLARERDSRKIGNQLI